MYYPHPEIMSCMKVSLHTLYDDLDIQACVRYSDIGPIVINTDRNYSQVKIEM